MTSRSKSHRPSRRPTASTRAALPAKPNFSHLDPGGSPRMVDISDKAVTVREASATAVVQMRTDVLDALLGQDLPKGDALSAARFAGIGAAKRTSEWIPLCHCLSLDWIHVEFTRRSPCELLISCQAKTSAKTGVEMEALVGAAAAALTIYDMAKSADRSMVIGPIQLESKSGGRSGTYRRRPKGTL